MDRSADWIYLGYNYEKYLKLNEKFGRSQLMQTFSEKLFERCDGYRKEFLGYINRVSEENEEIFWHLTESAENEAMDNHLFLNYCYVSVLTEIAENESEEILVIIENSDLFDVFKKHLSGMTHVPLKFLDIEVNRFSFRLDRVLRTIRNAVGFFRRAVYRKACIALYHKTRSRGAASSESVLVHVFANDASFRKDGTFHDAYLGKFISPIEASGRDILYLLHTGYATLSLKDIIRWVNHSDLKVIFLEELISLKELVAALFVPLKLKRTVLRGIPEEKGYLKLLLMNRLKREMHGGAFRSYYLYYLLMKKLARRDTKISHYLDVYEGHILERIMRLGARRHLPQCRILGFCHMAFSKNHISLFSSLNAGKVDLRPDFIFCTGGSYKDILLSNGFEASEVSVVGDLRGGGLNEYRYSIKNAGMARERVLVALPLAESDSQELFWKAVLAYSGTPYKVKIYKHPMMQLETLLGLLDERLPPNIKIAKEPTSSGLKNCDMVLTTGSTVSVNAMNTGLPVISLKKEVGLTFEPLDWFEAPISYCTTPEEIRTATKRILSQSLDEYEQYRNEAIALANSCLSPDIDMTKIHSVFLEKQQNSMSAING